MLIQIAVILSDAKSKLRLIITYYIEPPDAETVS